MDKLNGSQAGTVAAGIDMAKRTFAVCAVDVGQRVVLERTFNRGRLMEFFAKLPPCRIGLEACSGAHQLARELMGFGHTVGILAAKFVAPHRTSAKNDRNDARAIVDALLHPRSRFVPVKSEEQQALLSLQRARQGFIEERTALANRIRGLLAEFGVTLPVRIEKVRHRAAAAAQSLPLLARQVIEQLHAHLLVLDERIGQYDRQLRTLTHQSEPATRLTEVLGIGPVTALTTVAMIGNGREFKNGRCFSAWLGMVPRQYSTGGKTRLGPITHRGDRTLRMLFIQCAKALLAVAHRRQDRLSRWALAVRARRGFGKAAVAVAAKLARVAWAILAKGERFRLQPVSATSA